MRWKIFFRTISKILKEKNKSLSDENYIPFLGSVIVDVVSPETREVSLSEAILSKLDHISTRLNSVESLTRHERGSNSRRNLRSEFHNGTLNFQIPDEKFESFFTSAQRLVEVDNVIKYSTENGVSMVEVEFSGAESIWQLQNELTDIASRLGGELDIPF